MVYFSLIQIKNKILENTLMVTFLFCIYYNLMSTNCIQHNVNCEQKTLLFQQKLASTLFFLM